MYKLTLLITVKLAVRSLKAKDETTSSVLVYWPPAVDQLPTGHHLILEHVQAYEVWVSTYTDFRGPGAPCQHHIVPQSACPSITLRGLYASHKYYVSVVAVGANNEIITSPAAIVVETCKYTSGGFSKGYF